MPGPVPSKPRLDVMAGVRLYPGFLDRTEQEALVAELNVAAGIAPWFTPQMPRTGKLFSVRMTNLGSLGWVSDKMRGYRYQATHPVTGRPWPGMSAAVLAVWDAVSDYAMPPEACLVNHYEASAKMGLHQDRDEADFNAPVVSISLGDTCRFRIGGVARTDPTRGFELKSGDVLVFGGVARLAFHGVDRIMPGTSTLLAEGGRINMTLRRVT